MQRLHECPLSIRVFRRLADGFPYLHLALVIYVQPGLSVRLMAKGPRLKASPSSKEQVSEKDEQVAGDEQEGPEVGVNDRSVMGTRSRKRALADRGLAPRPSKMPALEIAKRISEVQATADAVVASRGSGRGRGRGRGRGKGRGKGRVAEASNATSSSATNFSSRGGWRRIAKSRVRNEASHCKARTASSQNHPQVDASPSQPIDKADCSLIEPVTPSCERQATEDCQDNIGMVQGGRASSTSAKKSSSPGKVEADAEGGSSVPKQNRRRKKKKRRPPVDELLRIPRRVRNLLVRLRQEQHLLDAYSSEGWKGQSKEKIRPERELQRAESKIRQCKLAIRDSIRDLDVLCLEGSIDQSAFDAEGQIYHEEIFCAKCKSQDALPDNDIILCDGFCNRGFHQNCLQPPLATKDIPPGDEGWLCPACEAKLDCVNQINAYLGTSFEVDAGWEEIFADEAAVAGGEGEVDPDLADWPSDDEEDDDFDPERAEKELSEDNGEEVDDDSGSSSNSSGSDSADEDAESSDQLHHLSGSHGADGSNEVSSSDKLDDGGGPTELPAGKRSRKTVDYKRLNDEMFGDKGEVDEDQEEWHSEDEDRGPRRRRRRRKAIADQKKVIESGLNRSSDCNRGASKALDDPEHRPESSCQEKRKRIVVRLPAGAIEIMRGEFAKNELPTRAAKDELAKQLGLSFRQVDQWFKNMRYHAIKNGLSTSSRPRNGDFTVRGLEGDAVKMTEAHCGGEPASAMARKKGFGDDGRLMEQLDEVEMKLHELKRSLDLEQQTSSSLGEEVKQESAPAPTNGKRIVYVPVAEVVEKSAE